MPSRLTLRPPLAQVIPVDNGSRLPSPEPIPPPISHHGFYMRPPPAWPGAFADSSNSEYYSESTAGSGLAHAQPYDPGAYILPPAPARVLVQAGKNPSFPTITVSAGAVPVPLSPCQTAPAPPAHGALSGRAPAGLWKGACGRG